MALEKLPVNLHSVIARSVEICEPDAIEKKLTLSLSLRASRQWVLADPGRLQQVMWNLIKNAVKFTPAGGSVIVESSSSADGGGIVVKVIDNGIGIDPQVLPRIFDAFEQGDPKITRQFGGLGLGLAISKLLMQQHEGTLEAYSDGVGCGSTFSLSLATIDGPQTKQAANQNTANAVPPRVLRILLVEDDSDTSLILGRLLRNLKHEVSAVGSCNAAFKAAGAGKFDLLICDLGLPDGSGHDVVVHLKADDPSLRAIALTGYGAADDIQRSFAAGFDAHLTKPITLDQLVQSIMRLFP
jgi:CheY-like chemotaxis protein